MCDGWLAFNSADVRQYYMPAACCVVDTGYEQILRISLANQNAANSKMRTSTRIENPETKADFKSPIFFLVHPRVDTAT
jgi:hypothetical protein